MLYGVVNGTVEARIIGKSTQPVRATSL
jgi:hypothetical protein